MKKFSGRINDDHIEYQHQCLDAVRTLSPASGNAHLAVEESRRVLPHTVEYRATGVYR
jgi:hypothetical protein